MTMQQETTDDCPKWYAIQRRHGVETPILFAEPPSKSLNSSIFENLVSGSVQKIPESLLGASIFQISAYFDQQPKTVLVDPIVEAVRDDLLSRSQVGIAKYGTTLARDDLSLRDWLQHSYEEVLDQANYLKRAIIESHTR